MPEGPEIRRARDEIAEAIEGRRVNELRFFQPSMAQWNGRFDGKQVVAVQSRGKAMLCHFSNGLSIYTHNQLYGRWVIAAVGEIPDSRRQLRLAVHTRQVSALLYSASDISVWSTDDLSQHPFLKKLGPDVLEPGTDGQMILARLLSAAYRKRRLGGFLTDQSFVAGLGNYLRCEILFAVGLHPQRRPCDLSDDQIRGLVASILTLPRQSYKTAGITNDLSRARKLMTSGATFEQARFLVFRRAGAACYRCGATIVVEKQGGQRCYLCPDCQPSVE